MLRQCYHESDIVEAVIRALSPSLRLRSYLEMMSKLSLIRLKQILRADFKEKTRKRVIPRTNHTISASKRVGSRYCDEGDESS